MIQISLELFVGKLILYVVYKGLLDIQGKGDFIKQMYYELFRVVYNNFVFYINFVMVDVGLWDGSFSILVVKIGCCVISVWIGVCGVLGVCVLVRLVNVQCFVIIF